MGRKIWRGGNVRGWSCRKSSVVPLLVGLGVLFFVCVLLL